AWTVERNIDTDAIIFEVSFETVAVNFHLLKSHHCLKSKPVVLRLDFASVINWVLRDDSRGLQKKDDTTQQSRDSFAHWNWTPRKTAGTALPVAACTIKLRGIGQVAAIRGRL